MTSLTTSPPLARALAERNFDSLMPVQTAVLADEASGRDLLVSAQTGSGKTVAYGLAIADEFEKQTGRTVMISSVHKTLVRLEEKGYLKSHMGGATETRGGRDKRLYKLTQAGIAVLNQSRELRNSMHKHVPKIAWEGK